jgi:uncharacterized protein YaeQ
MWWTENAGTLARLANLRVVDLDVESTRALAAAVGRSMTLSCTIQDGHIWLAQGGETLEIVPHELKGQAP